MSVDLFFDPKGHRLELAATCLRRRDGHLDARQMGILEMVQTRRAPKHAAWMHAPADA